jgi:type IV pilus assembly protein PilE
MMMNNTLVGSNQRSFSAQHGFTLIEVMIVVAIVAILTAIALPSYTEYVRRSERANAQSKLSEAAQWLERNYTTNNKYPTTIAGYDTSKYAVTLSAATDTSFTLQAAPSGTYTDADCGSLTLTNVGLKGSTTGDAKCWKK